MTCLFFSFCLLGLWVVGRFAFQGATNPSNLALREKKLKAQIKTPRGAKGKGEEKGESEWSFLFIYWQSNLEARKNRPLCQRSLPQQTTGLL